MKHVYETSWTLTGKVRNMLMLLDENATIERNGKDMTEDECISLARKLAKEVYDELFDQRTKVMEIESQALYGSWHDVCRELFRLRLLIGE